MAMTFLSAPPSSTPITSSLVYTRKYGEEKIACTAAAASREKEAAAAVQAIFSSPYFRVYTNDDVIGVELGGALKNVMAIATGAVNGLGLGYNSAAALVTRGLAEMTRLAV